MGIISDIPEFVKKNLGKTKSEIISTLVESIVQESYDKDKIKMNNSIFEEFVKFRER